MTQRVLQSVARVTLAVLLGALAGLYVYLYWPTQAATEHSDLGQLWAAARALVGGRDPYAEVGPHRAFHWWFPLLYPMPAVVAVTPLAGLAEHTADAVFVGIGVAALTWALAGRKPGPTGAVLVLATAPAIAAAKAAQWSLVATGLAVLPSPVALGALAAVKPNLAIPLLAWRLPRTRRDWLLIVGAGALLVAASFALRPGWLLEWLRALDTAEHITSPIVRPWGVLLLLAALRWRRPEARLLLALAVLPQSPFFYEAIPLFLIPASFVQTIALLATTWAGYLHWHYLPQPPSYNVWAAGSANAMVWSAYLPALAMVLARPNREDA